MSDVHANPAALETALEDARMNGCGMFILLGDMTGYGYDAKSVVERCMDSFDVVLLGNHDAVCTGLDAGVHVILNRNYDVDRMQRAELSDGELEWIRGRECAYEGRGFVCVHGDAMAPRAWGYILGPEDAERNFRHFTERILFCGHSHHAAAWELSQDGLVHERLDERLSLPVAEPESVCLELGDTGRYIVNVGSVGYPRSDLCTVYGVYDDEAGMVTFRRLPFDFDGYVKAKASRGHDLPAWLARLMAARAK